MRYRVELREISAHAWLSWWNAGHDLSGAIAEMRRCVGNGWAARVVRDDDVQIVLIAPTGYWL